MEIFKSELSLAIANNASKTKIGKDLVVQPDVKNDDKLEAAYDDLTDNSNDLQKQILADKEEFSADENTIEAGFDNPAYIEMDQVPETTDNLQADTNNVTKSTEMYEADTNYNADGSEIYKTVLNITMK